jgi:hypothetical protein
MSAAPDTPRNWTGTYIRVLLIEALVIWLLWLVSRHFSY